MSKPSILSALSESALELEKQDNAAELACRDVIGQILQQTNAEDIELILFHTSTSFDLDQIATVMATLLSGIPTVGCTSAGEFNQNGYATERLLAIAFLKSDFAIATAMISNLDELSFEEAHKVAGSLRRSVQRRKNTFENEDYFVMSFLDGLTRHEENFLETFASAFGNIPHLGGSAGDDLKLKATYVFDNGQFHQNAAVLMLVATRKPFTVFSLDHINSPVSKLVVTNADPMSRTVYEINGEPAAQYYARLLGMKVSDLTPDVFSLFPLAVMVGGKYFIRSIQRVDMKTGGITFYCAVDIGIILTFVQLGDCIEAIDTKLHALQDKMGKPEFVYACDCFLRRLEIQQNQNDYDIQVLHNKYHITGFNAYGEHIHSVHLNQTFTGVYFAAD